MDEIRRFDLCLKELELVQGHIARYDANGLTIKSWALATASALAAYAVVHRSGLIALIGAFATLGFASVELVYRCFQARFSSRAVALEAVLNGNDVAAYRYALSSSAMRSQWPSEMLAALKLPHFILLYVLVIAVSLIVAVALWLDWLPVLSQGLPQAL